MLARDASWLFVSTFWNVCQLGQGALTVSRHILLNLVQIIVQILLKAVQPVTNRLRPFEAHQRDLILRSGGQSQCSSSNLATSAAPCTSCRRCQWRCTVSPCKVPLLEYIFDRSDGDGEGSSPTASFRIPPSKASLQVLFLSCMGLSASIAFMQGKWLAVARQGLSLAIRWLV